MEMMVHAETSHVLTIVLGQANGFVWRSAEKREFFLVDCNEGGYRIELIISKVASAKTHDPPGRPKPVCFLSSFP